MELQILNRKDNITEAVVKMMWHYQAKSSWRQKSTSRVRGLQSKTDRSWKHSWVLYNKDSTGHAMTWVWPTETEVRWPWTNCRDYY